MNTLAILSSILSIVGFFIQITDKFSQKKELRNKILFSIYGFTVGIIAGVFNRTEIKIQEDVTLEKLFAIFVGVGLLAILVIFAVGFIKDRDGKKDAPLVLGGGFVSLLLMIIVGGLAIPSYSESNPVKEKEELSYLEYRISVDGLKDAGRFEEAFEYLEKARAGLIEPDMRIEHTKKIGLEIYNLLLASEGINPVTEEDLQKRYDEYLESRRPKIVTIDQSDQSEGANQAEVATP